MITASDLAVSIITNVGAEHLAALGGSLETIATAKSGIIKKGRPVRWFLMHVSVYSVFPKTQSKCPHMHALWLGNELECAFLID